MLRINVVVENLLVSSFTGEAVPGVEKGAHVLCDSSPSIVREVVVSESRVAKRWVRSRGSSIHYSGAGFFYGRICVGHISGLCITAGLGGDDRQVCGAVVEYSS